MASSVIHMCIAKEINKKLKMDQNEILLGTIAPDISKHLGKTKVESHFLSNGHDIDIDAFLNKYGKNLNEPFLMGYFIHLYADLLWDKYFVSEIVEKNCIKLLDGTKVEKTPELYKKLIYNDYTNLNIKLIDEYNLDLSLFYEEFRIPNVDMSEIPIDKLLIIIEQAGFIIQNTKEQKAYVFELENIIKFIEIATNLIYSKICEIF